MLTVQVKLYSQYTYIYIYYIYTCISLACVQIARFHDVEGEAAAFSSVGVHASRNLHSAFTTFNVSSCLGAVWGARWKRTTFHHRSSDESKGEHASRSLARQHNYQHRPPLLRRLSRTTDYSTTERRRLTVTGTVVARSVGRSVGR